MAFIKEISIDQFGIWRDLTLPLTAHGLTVVYGPNEAGKTTLMRFLHGALFGFSGDSRQTATAASNLSIASYLTNNISGRLRIEHHGRSCDIQIASAQTGRELISVSSPNTDAASDDWMTEIRAGIDGQVFRNVFAVGLQELQELATLHDEPVAQRIYSMTLGPDGQRLLAATTRHAAAHRRLYDTQDHSGELYELFDRYDRIGEEIQSVDNRKQRYVECCRQTDDLESHIADVKKRQHGLQEELRGHLFLERVWPHWDGLQQLQSELETLPVVHEFPESSLERLDELDHEIAAAKSCRDEILDEAKKMRQRIREFDIDPEWKLHVVTIQSFVDQREWLRTLESKLGESLNRLSAAQAELENRRHGLGEEWSAARLEAAETGPTAHFQLVHVSRKFQLARIRTVRFRRRYQKNSQVCQQRLAELNDRVKQLDSMSIEAALDAARSRLHDLEELERRCIDRLALERRKSDLEEHRSRLQQRVNLPRRMSRLWSTFIVGGSAMTLVGFVTGIAVTGIAGTAYALFWVCCLGLFWSLTSFCKRQVRGDLNRLNDELQQTEKELQQQRQAIGPLEAQSAFRRQVERDAQTDSPPDEIENAVRTIAELEHWKQRQHDLKDARRKLSELRGRYQHVQRDVTAARNDWCALLRQLGFPETVRIKETLEEWQLVAKGQQQQQIVHAAQNKLANCQQEFEAFRQRIKELGHRMHCWDQDYDRPGEVLAVWEEQLKSYANQRKERHRLRKEENHRRRETREYQSMINKLTTRRRALLVQGGAASREEFEHRAEAYKRRQELDVLLQEAEAELAAVAETEPQLAVVAEDLHRFDPAENADRIDMLNCEREDLERDLEQAFESLGHLKREISELETDRRGTQLRLEREQLKTEIRRTAERWCAVKLAGESLAKIRRKFERSHQPSTIAAASRYLERMTQGKHPHIWTPLGERLLYVDDDRGDTFTVEQLSGGTREQLFLAIRLALVEQMAQQGVELPILLDDVLVNFDESRATSAAELLIDIAAHGQQIVLFTCHQHLASLFESKGIMPKRLPDPESWMTERRAG